MRKNNISEFFYIDKPTLDKLPTATINKLGKAIFKEGRWNYNTKDLDVETKKERILERLNDGNEYYARLNKRGSYSILHQTEEANEFESDGATAGGYTEEHLDFYDTESFDLRHIRKLKPDEAFAVVYKTHFENLETYLRLERVKQGIDTSQEWNEETKSFQQTAKRNIKKTLKYFMEMKGTKVTTYELNQILKLRLDSLTDKNEITKNLQIIHHQANKSIEEIKEDTKGVAYAAQLANTKKMVKRARLAKAFSDLFSIPNNLAISFFKMIYDMGAKTWNDLEASPEMTNWYNHLTKRQKEKLGNVFIRNLKTGAVAFTFKAKKMITENFNELRDRGVKKFLVNKVKNMFDYEEGDTGLMFVKKAIVGFGKGQWEAMKGIFEAGKEALSALADLLVI